MATFALIASSQRSAVYVSQIDSPRMVISVRLICMLKLFAKNESQTSPIRTISNAVACIKNAIDLSAFINLSF